MGFQEEKFPCDQIRQSSDSERAGSLTGEKSSVDSNSCLREGGRERETKLELGFEPNLESREILKGQSHHERPGPELTLRDSTTPAADDEEDGNPRSGQIS